MAKQLSIFDEGAEQRRFCASESNDSDTDSDDEENLFILNENLEIRLKKMFDGVREVLNKSHVFFSVYINRYLFKILREVVDTLHQRAPQGLVGEIWERVNAIHRLLQVNRMLDFCFRGFS